MIFQQDGRPFIHYFSRAWIVDDEGDNVREAAQETGFLRPQEDGTLEVVLAHNTGFVEIWHGEIHPEQPRFEIVTDAVVRTATAKEYIAGKRLYGYVNGDLLYAYDMAADGPGAPAAHPRPAGQAVARVPSPTGASGSGSSGYRLTPAARADPRAPSRRSGTPRPTRCCAEVREQSTAVNVSTVYRTLEVLEELGLVRHAHLSDRAPTYHSVERPRALPPGLPELPHASISVDPDVLDSRHRPARAPSTGSPSDVGHLTVFGHCVGLLRRSD